MKTEEVRAIFRQGETATIKFVLDIDRRCQKQAATIEALEKRIAVLSKDSSTSSKRPSSDDITKKAKKDKKKPNSPKKKKGGQKGHKRNSRPAFKPDEIDETIEYTLAACPKCNSANIIITSDQNPKKVQQIEIKEVPIVVSEYLAYPYWCENCQCYHYAELPEHVVKAGLFGEKMTALVAYMKNVCHSSFSTIRKFFRDVLHVTVSRGYLAKLIRKVSMALQDPYEELLNQLPLEEVVYADETGHKNNGDRFWTWVFKAELYVLFKIDKSRGSKVLIDILGKDFEGVLSCDYFSAYRKYMKDFNVTIQFCIAHLIRNVKFLTTLKNKQTQVYAKQLLSRIREMFHIIHNREEMTEELFNSQLQTARQKIIDAATIDAPSKLNKDGKEELTEVANMVNRFRKHGDSYFEFITTPGVEPTNNLAEQAIRFIVIDRHITQGTRSVTGQSACEKLWTVIGTCAMQGRSAFNFILAAVTSYFRQTSCPSLLPDTS
ncbi:MAG: IS66 family transposase [Pseudomonadota bacterium]|nr:IS66 family transposase [Pseudomonadota bacterium]